MSTIIPLSLYIHIPWCVKKCPYCDFNSHAVQDQIPEEAYIKTLLRDLDNDLPFVQNRRIKSIFFGGGTPSLFSPKGIENLLNDIEKRLTLEPNAEITLEANPGTLEHKAFSDYRLAGINRLSLGIQSFQNDKLTALGRIHNADESKRAIECLSVANFKSFNLDLMYGLPNQTLEDALFDLETALSFCPPHLSWYNLTIEPNTVFHQKRPPLPSEDTLFEMELAGLNTLKSHKLSQYEVSAFSQENHQCQHNMNYWEFGDYLGIGAGAHGKITDTQKNTITRYWKTRYPKTYLSPNHILLAGTKTIPQTELPLEFMLNALRLTHGIPASHFEQRTILTLSTIESILKKAEVQGFLTQQNDKITPTELGKRFLNDLILQFSPQP